MACLGGRTAEMSAAMVIWAIVLLAFGWLEILPKSRLALMEHGLMMPIMLIPMFLRLDLYTGRAGNMTHAAHAAGRRWSHGKEGVDRKTTDRRQLRMKSSTRAPSPNE